MQIKCIQSKKNVVKYNQVPTYDLDSTDGREGSESWVFFGYERWVLIEKHQSYQISERFSPYKLFHWVKVILYRLCNCLNKS